MRDGQVRTVHAKLTSGALMLLRARHRFRVTVTATLDGGRSKASRTVMVHS